MDACSDLINHITSLESQSRHEQSNYMYEVIKHKETQSQLTKVQEELKIVSDRERSLSEKVAHLSLTLESEVNVSRLLKEDIKTSKLEMGLMKDHLAKEEEGFNRDRQFFLERLDLVIKDARKQRDEYTMIKEKLPVIQTSGLLPHCKEDCNHLLLEEDIRRLNEEVAGLKQSLNGKHPEENSMEQAVLKEKDDIIQHLQGDLKQSQKYVESLEKVLQEFQEMIIELQASAKKPCVYCGKAPSIQEEALPLHTSSP